MHAVWGSGERLFPRFSIARLPRQATLSSASFRALPLRCQAALPISPFPLRGFPLHQTGLPLNVEAVRCPPKTRGRLSPGVRIWTFSYRACKICAIVQRRKTLVFAIFRKAAFSLPPSNAGQNRPSSQDPREGSCTDTCRGYRANRQKRPPHPVGKCRWPRA